MSTHKYRQSEVSSRRGTILLLCVALLFAGIGAAIYFKFHRRAQSDATSIGIKTPSARVWSRRRPLHVSGSHIASDTSARRVSRSELHKRYENSYFNLIRPTAHGPLPKSSLKRSVKLTARLIRGDGPKYAAMIPIVKNVMLGKTRALENELDVGVSPNLTAWMGPRGNWSLLCYAIAAGQRGSIKVLMRHGAYVNPSQYSGASSCAPLVLAGSAAEDDVVRYLLANGADVNQTSPNKNTALSQAVLLGNYYTVDLLLKHGAPVKSVLGPDGSLPIRLAESKSPRYVAIRKLLIAKGAKMPSTH